MKRKRVRVMPQISVVFTLKVIVFFLENAGELCFILRRKRG
jgi:hypothetical protein